MKKLIAMADYVLEIEKTPYYAVPDYEGGRPTENAPAKACRNIEEMYNKILKYAQFLKQPLTLGMFVPTDSEGNVLEDCVSFDPDISSQYYSSQIYQNQLYKEAQEKVIFKDISIFAIEEFNKQFVYHLVDGNKNYLEYDVNTKTFKNEYRVSCFTIKGITNCDFELTDSAVFNLFGEK